MKIRKKWLATIFLAILLVSLTAPVLVLPTWASDDGTDSSDLRVVPGIWYKLETDIVTVLFPDGGKKPIFIWWYTKAPDQIYVVKYQGLIEYFAFDHPLLPPKPEYYKRMREALHERFTEMYMMPKEQELMGMGSMGMMKLMILRQIMLQIDATWHRPFLPFSAGTWSLSDVKNITTDGKIIGVTFAFKLVKLPDWMPGLKFAENNIMIKVRFYNTTVKEMVPGTDIEYTVNAGEMKMDLVVNKWVWNIDAIKELIAYLKEHEIDVNVPQGKTRLALWVNLALINITMLEEAKEEPLGEDRIEAMSTASHMEIESVGHVSIEENRTTWTGVEGEEKPIIAQRPWWAPWLPPEKPLLRLTFATEDKTLAGFFRFVSSAKVTTPENVTSKVAVRASYIAAGHHLRLFIGYPYFGNGTLEHDPSFGLDVPEIDTTPQYAVKAPSGTAIEPVVIGEILPLFITPELAAALIGAASLIAIVILVAKWKRKVVNIVGVSKAS